MGCPRIRCGWSSLGRLGGALFWLSLLGLGASVVLAGWAHRLKSRVGDHVDLAVSGGEGYLWPGTAGIAVVLVAPVHVLGVALRAGLAKDLACRRMTRRRTNDGKSLDRLLFLHAVLCCLSGLLVFGACAGSVYFWSVSRRRVRSGLYRVMRRYPLDMTIKARVDRLQIELSCCGSESYVDWFFVPWTMAVDEEEEVDEEEVEEEEEEEEEDVFGDKDSIEQQQRSPIGPEFIAADVPYSCCSAEAPRACVHRDVVLGDYYAPEAGPRAHLRPATRTRTMTISSEGCEGRLLARADSDGRQLVACLLALSVYQLTLSILSRVLQTARQSANNAKAARLVGWIFGRGPRTLQPLPPPPRSFQPQEIQPLRGSSRRRRCEDDSEDSAASETTRSMTTPRSARLAGSGSPSNGSPRAASSPSARRKKPKRGTIPPRDEFGDAADGSGARIAERFAAKTRPANPATAAAATPSDEKRGAAAAARQQQQQKWCRAISREYAASPRMQMRRQQSETPPDSRDEEDEEEEESRNLNSADAYGRFRGTLQATLERRQRGAAPGCVQQPSSKSPPRASSWRLVDERRRESPAGRNRRASSSSSSSSSLPPLPSTPPRRAPRPSQRKNGNGRTEELCPLHDRRCPVHPFVDGRKFPTARSSGSCCPVHGDVDSRLR